MIADLIFLFYLIILISGFCLFCHFLVWAFEKFDKTKIKRERRAEIRKEFKREINNLRNDDGVYFEVFDGREEAV